jgi:hypothetical protein
MIISVWKPKFSKFNGEKIVSHYELTETDDLISNNRKGWIVVYVCDVCKTNLSHTRSHVLLSDKTKLNKIDRQTCHSCRSRISEYEIKENYIKYEVIKESIEKFGYKLLTDKEEYMKSNNRSQFRIKSICNNNHELHITWNNWSKNKKCRICYEQNKFTNAIKYKNGYERYKFLVNHYTEKNYKKYFNEINPNKYNRGTEYHLDHKFSIYEGFIKGISPKIIGGYKNLSLIDSKKNMSKQKKCSVTLNEII